MKKILSVLLILFLLVGCTRYSGGEPVETKEEKDKVEEKIAEEKKEEPEKELTIDEKITKQLNDKLGKESNTKKKRIISLEVNDHAGTEVEGDKIILVTLTGNENLSLGMTVKGLLMDSGKTFQAIFSNDEAQEVALFWRLPLIDAYGKTTEDNVLKVTLSRENYEKIEWKSFDYDNFAIVADQFWMHQALKEE